MSMSDEVLTALGAVVTLAAEHRMWLISRATVLEVDLHEPDKLYQWAEAHPDWVAWALLKPRSGAGSYVNRAQLAWLAQDWASE